MFLRGSAWPAVFLVVVSAAMGTAAEDEAEAFRAIGWTPGPTTGRLGDVAEISVPLGYAFTPKAGARKFMELTENPPSGHELGVIVPSGDDVDEFWFVIFEFADVGYVRDDERDKLDANALLESIREGTKRGNEIRRSKGWATMEILGWDQPPFYDSRTNNLTWAIRGKSGDQEQSAVTVNYSTRLLGRRGYLSANLVLGAEEVESALPRFERLISGVAYVHGNKYAEYRRGDKVAAYGLTALVAGGAGAALAKSGLLAKFWKLIAGALIAFGAAARSLWRRFSGERDTFTT